MLIAKAPTGCKFNAYDIPYTFIPPKNPNKGCLTIKQKPSKESATQLVLDMSVRKAICPGTIGIITAVVGAVAVLAIVAAVLAKCCFCKNKSITDYQLLNQDPSDGTNSGQW